MLTGAIEANLGEIVLRGVVPKAGADRSDRQGNLSGVPGVQPDSIPYSGRERILWQRDHEGSVRRQKAMAAEVQKALDEFEIELNPMSVISDLGVAYQQITEIVKAVMSNSRVLIMDEPTAPLTNKETELLFNIVDKLKKNKVTIIFISHRMEEMFEICDRVTVLRDGKYISTKDIKDITRKELIADMVGRELGEDYPERVKPLGETVLQVKGLTNDKVKDVSFEVKRGRNPWLWRPCGSRANGSNAALFGADRVESGEVYLNGKQIRIKNPGEALDHGIGLIPEDRKNQGVLLGLSIKENVTFSSLKQAMKDRL